MAYIKIEIRLQASHTHLAKENLRIAYESIQKMIDTGKFGKGGHGKQFYGAWIEED